MADLRKHKNCVTDPLTREWWRDYRHVTEAGNPLGLSFVEYVIARAVAMQPQIYTGNSASAPWYMASCGHTHPWGYGCNVNAVT